MDRNSSPLLSAIIVAHCDSPNLRMALEFQREQTVSQRMELIVVTASGERLNLRQEELEGFWGIKIVETGSNRDAGLVKAAGVAAATAPLVAFIEDHSFPAPDCAQAFINAHYTGNSPSRVRSC
ncbi:MAG: glycosyltransferase [Syntrophobacteraceae bacterium]